MAEEPTQSIKIPGRGRCSLTFTKHAIIRETRELEEMEQMSMGKEFREPTDSNLLPALSSPPLGRPANTDSFENELMGNPPNDAFVVTNNSRTLDTRCRAD